ncbi:hypothetical protein OJ996_04955 [Luteolibacter sp. GHJ8]|uniref:Secreted protein n=1 Tax=Luteolibacter rhizosphaerae TaxID=2989719 RepID=A0ABT3G001_9BACT|nr:hypothetical protein [Luteolibacter rhizosphaerae]
MERVLLYREIHHRFMFLEVLFASLAYRGQGGIMDLATDRSTSGLFGDFRFRPPVEAEHRHGICHPVKDCDLHAAICSPAETSPPKRFCQSPA